MTAPARTKTAASRTSAPEHEDAGQRERGTGTASRQRSAAAERAYARREERRAESAVVALDRPSRPVREVERVPQRKRTTETKSRPQPKVATSRVPFVVAVMGLLVLGLASTLWLSIAAISGSYQLQRGEAEINSLSDRKEQLMRDVSSMDSTPALQQRAAQQGMVPGGEPARLVTNPDGSVRVVGEPKAAVRNDPPLAAPAPASPAPGPAAPAPPAVAVEGR